MQRVLFLYSDALCIFVEISSYDYCIEKKCYAKGY
jgi:hypothetical protein